MNYKNEFNISVENHLNEKELLDFVFTELKAPK
jgi:hypothetical protein